MKAWIANAIWGALHILSKRLFNWVTDADRHRRIRFKHRKAWYEWHQVAIAKNSLWRTRLAVAYGIQWKFIASPTEAVMRGDLPPKGRK